jgi:Tol biopolymer transport system component
VVLYEMLAGRRPFAGGSELEELKTIVHGTALSLPEAIPAALRAIVEKALEKDPADRYQSMREMVVDLRRLTRQSGVSAPAPSRRRWARAAPAAALLVAGFISWRIWRAPENTEPLRAVPLTTLRGVQRHPTLSPDGNYVAFSWSGPEQNNPDIWVQQIGAGGPLQLTTDPANDFDPTWSPDGRWIAFLRSKPEPGKSDLLLKPPLGGPERKLAEIAVSGMEVIPPHLAWCPDSNCLVTTDSPGQGQPDSLFVISLETGGKTRLTHPQHPIIGDTNPAISLDGSWLVFSRRAHLFSGEIYVVPLGKGITAAGEPRRLTPAAMDAIYPAWMRGGKEILFSSKRGLWRLAVSGEKPPSRLPFIGEDGIMPVVAQTGPGRSARLVYVRSSFDGNIWRIDTSGPGLPASSPPVAAVSSTRNEGMPQLSPDGRRVAFWSDRSGDDEIWVSDLDGSNAIQLTSRGAPATGYPHWSPDGQLITFHSSPEGKGDVYVIPAAGGKPRNLTNHPPKEAFPSFSRDGKWIYFTSSRSRDDRVWKIQASGGDAVQVTNNVGYMPLESPDGAYLYYVDAVFTPGSLWRMPVSGGVAVKVLDGVVLGNYVPLDKGTYYIDRPSGEKGIHYFDLPSGETRLQYFDFATHRSTTIARNLGNVDTPLSATSDGRTIVFCRTDSSVDDLMLVENFR